MKSLVIAFLLMLPFHANAHEEGIVVVEYVKVLNDHHEAALAYYENNWKHFRDIALQQGYIKGYKLLATQPDEAADYDLVLMTSYQSTSQYKAAEARFQEIIKQERPDGPLFINELRPPDFKKNLYSKTAHVKFED